MPRSLPLCSALAGWLVAPGLAVADAEKIDCGNAQSTYEINACADKEFSSADAELNAAYQAALKAVPQFAAGEKPYDARSWKRRCVPASGRGWLIATPSARTTWPCSGREEAALPPTSSAA